ncbi:MAG: DUF2497 domain-containing protein [Brevundimonas sp.]|nr:DUF2497 domain-containing protein [Brevundimonas sp.]
MTDQTAQEPTMEEILASIRRIISEDDAPAETAEAAAAQPDAESAPVPQASPVEAEAEAVSPALMDETPSMEEPAASEEDVLELTDTYEEPAAESIGDLDVSPAGEDVEPFPVEAVSDSVFAPEPEHPADTTSHGAPTGYDTLVGDSAAASAASAFAGLASSLKKPEPMETSTPAGPTLDELARALLRPMLKEWLDANLPAIVEAEVRKEVERIARNAG